VRNARRRTRSTPARNLIPKTGGASKPYYASFERPVIIGLRDHERDIRSKLRREFSEPITSERQVVYILVEIRKLLELNDDAEYFPALTFYCDWAAHAVMDKEGAKRIVRRFNEWQRISDEARLSGIEPILDQHFRAELDETTELRRFREQLDTYLTRNQLDSSVAAERLKWRAFVEFYAQVIEACPLKCSEPGLQYVDEVIIKFLDLRGINPDDFSVAIQWSWINKRTGHESRTHAFF